jgi:hypothetical protein
MAFPWGTVSCNLGLKITMDITAQKNDKTTFEYIFWNWDGKNQTNIIKVAQIYFLDD